MTRAFSSVSRRVGAFLRADESGTATVEFALLFPPFFLIFASSVEAGLMMIRNVQLERGLDIAVREIRIGTPVPPTFAEFRTTICQQATLVPNCMQNLQVELQIVSSDTWQPLDNRPRCVDRNSVIDPFNAPDYNQGGNNDFMLVRLCANVDPILPGFGLGAIIDRIPSEGEPGDEDYRPNGYAIVAVSAFVNEPSR
jgi:Flp pilus assembly protein TadG